MPSESWRLRVQDVVDQAHAENWGGQHVAAFCKACADAYIVAQYAVPDSGPANQDAMTYSTITDAMVSQALTEMDRLDMMHVTDAHGRVGGGPTEEDARAVLAAALNQGEGAVTPMRLSAAVPTQEDGHA